jgi:competence protein ComEA
MSLYRKLLVAVATMGLATFVYAADEGTTTTSTTTGTGSTDTQTATPTTTDTTASATPTTTTDTTTTTTAMGDKVDLNKATARELMKVKGITAARAKAIITYRKKHGDFKTVDDLKEVKGFKKLSDKKLQEITDQVTTS